LLFAVLKKDDVAAKVLDTCLVRCDWNMEYIPGQLALSHGLADYSRLLRRLVHTE
jgi:hypothetical protein